MKLDSKGLRQNLIENIPFGLSLILFSCLLWAQSKGLDITDESFYLINSHYPGKFPVITQFGYFLHPFYKLLNFNVYGFRLFQLAGTFLIALLIYKNLQKAEQSRSILGVLLLSMGYYFQGGLFSPSYNWVNTILLGFILVCFLRLQKKQESITTIILSFLNVLIFINKLTTGFTTLVLSLLFLFFFSKNKLKSTAIFLLSYLISGFYFFYFFFDSNDYQMVQRSLEITKDLKPGYETLDSIIYFILAIYNLLKVPLIISSSVFAFNWALKKKKLFFLPRHLQLNVILIWYSLTHFINLNSIFKILPLFLITYFLDKTYENIQRNSLSFLIKKKFVKGFCIAFLSFAFFAGTNTTPEFLLSYCIIFLVLGVYSIEGLGVYSRAFISCILFAITLKSFPYPYRLPAPIWEHTQEFKHRNFSLSLDQNSKKFLSELIDLAAKESFTEGTKVVDFTGASPGLVYLLGGTPSHMAWTLGGYPGSEKNMRTSLKWAGRKAVKNSWIFLSPESPVSISSEALSVVDLNLQQDYRKAFSLDNPYTGKKIEIWKPLK